LALREVYSVDMPAPLAMSFTESIKSAQRRTFYDQHRVLAVSMIVIVLILPFVGLLVGGLFGVIAGALVSFAAYYLAPYVVLKLGV
jgi:fatty-acid desaturase